MLKDVIVRAVITWLLFIPVATVNGAVRNFLYQPKVGALLAHQISTLTGSIAYFTLAYFMFRNVVTNTSYGRLLLIGLAMVLATIVFEFGFGHYVMGNSWEKLLADYNVFKGRIWILVLIVIAVTPMLIKYIKTSS